MAEHFGVRPPYFWPDMAVESDRNNGVAEGLFLVALVVSTVSWKEMIIGKVLQNHSQQKDCFEKVGMFHSSRSMTLNFELFQRQACRVFKVIRTYATFRLSSTANF